MDRAYHFVYCNELNIEGLRKFTAHVIFLTKPFEDVFQQNEKVNQERGMVWIPDKVDPM